MPGKIRRLLPHAAILICNMYIVFYLIDRVNTAMNFIDNDLTKGLLAILCVAGIVNFMTVLSMERAARRQSEARRRGNGYGAQYASRYGGADGYSARRAPSSRQSASGYGSASRYRDSGTSRRVYDDDRRYGSRDAYRASGARTRRY